MDYVLTLVASRTPLSDDLVRSFCVVSACRTADVRWIAPEKAVDISIDAQLPLDEIKGLRNFLMPHRVDLFCTSVRDRVKKLFLADMDATIVEGETLDDLAAYVGLKERISQITARAMRGELDFREALRERVGLLKNLPEAALHETLAKTKLNDGALTLLRTLRANGVYCVLVSGGFTVFTENVAHRTGFDAHHGNTLEIRDGVLTGIVLDPILDKNAKESFLRSYAQEKGVPLARTLAMGDGANDLPMLQAAGLGIGYRPKPLVEEKIPNLIVHGTLDAALYAQGLVPVLG